MFKRQRTGSVVCASCGNLVGVNDEACYNCGRRNPGLWGWGPALRNLGRDMGFIPFVTGFCVVLYVLSLASSGGQIFQGGGGLFGLLSPSVCSNLRFGASGGPVVFELGRWWTVLSAAWLHGSLLHILFNMYWIRQLAPAVAEMYGPGRMVIVYTVAAIGGFLLTSVVSFVLPGLPGPLAGANVTVGASAPIFGLLGAVMYYGHRGGSSYAYAQAKSLALVMFIFGFLMPGVDNYAHAGGFGGGWFAAQILDPLKPERIDHLAIAVGCLVLSVLSVVVSLVVPLGLSFCP
jgi:rhomboid protease GluP